MKKGKKAQLWIETVIYTLIGLAIIGILLTFSKPKIDEIQDKLLIEQTIDSLNKIDSKIYEVQSVPGNKRIMDVKLSKGKLVIDAQNDRIEWIIESSYKYSEPGTVINLGNLKVLTSGTSPYTINLSIPYTLDLTYNFADDYKEFDAAPSPYSLGVENLGSKNGRSNINLVIQ